MLTFIKNVPLPNVGIINQFSRSNANVYQSILLPSSLMLKFISELNFLSLMLTFLINFSSLIPTIINQFSYSNANFINLFS